MEATPKMTTVGAHEIMVLMDTLRTEYDNAYRDGYLNGETIGCWSISTEGCTDRDAYLWRALGKLTEWDDDMAQVRADIRAHAGMRGRVERAKTEMALEVQ